MKRTAAPQQPKNGCQCEPQCSLQGSRGPHSQQGEHDDAKIACGRPPPRVTGNVWAAASPPPSPPAPTLPPLPRPPAASALHARWVGPSFIWVTRLSGSAADSPPCFGFFFFRWRSNRRTSSSLG